MIRDKMAYHIATTVPLVILHTLLMHFSQHTKADMAINCTKFTYCINKYADIYKSLTSEENSFNIQSALYPSLKPSSLIVKVQIYGQNNTLVANYTWSLNCLYAAFPSTFLELLSLGAILVTPTHAGPKDMYTRSLSKVIISGGPKSPYKRCSCCGKSYSFKILSCMMLPLL